MTTNSSLWYFIVCIPGAAWDSIQLLKFFFQGVTKKRKGAKRMPFKESHPRLFVLWIAFNAIFIVALPIGFWLAFHPANSKFSASSPVVGIPKPNPSLQTRPQQVPKHSRAPHKAKVLVVPATPVWSQTTTPVSPQFTPAPTYQQKCEGSVCAQGPGSQATLNQYGAPKLLMTDAQRDLIRDGMTSYAGTSVTVFCYEPTEDSLAYTFQIAKALHDAGLTVVGPNQVSFVGYVPPAGVSITIGNNAVQVASSLSTAMENASLIKEPLPTRKIPGAADKFIVVVAPNR